ncbi:Vacuolar sorting-associated 13C [Brachionus plicatilis]|uniref:Vacuolar sorting-associated 13C n=1 Tax=Brachionus plicatilis TaxID=10195 RepID=A0A3M7SLE5_BRAPC|nr:Vacuolar sorting-associated 13C [Brachionus plicatilis]
MSNLYRTCALCKIRFDSKPKLNRNKIGISSSWVKITLRTLGIEWKHYKYVCFDCHRDGFQEALFQIDPEIENVPEVTTGSFCFDYASIEDKRCQILTGISKENFLELYNFISHVNITGNVSLINALGFYLTKLRTGVTLKELSAFTPIASNDQIKRSVRQIRNIVSELFAPLYLGFNSTTRDEILSKHTTKMSQILLNADVNDANEDNKLKYQVENYSKRKKSSRVVQVEELEFPKIPNKDHKISFPKKDLKNKAFP